MAWLLAIRVGLEELAIAYTWIDALAERYAVPHACRVSMQIVVEEALSNIIRHGYPERPTAQNDRIHLMLEVTDAALDLTIEDRGIPFNPCCVPDPVCSQSLDDVRTGGQGIPMIRRRVQSMTYERRDGLNRLTLRFDRAPCVSVPPVATTAA